MGVRGWGLGCPQPAPHHKEMKTVFDSSLVNQHYFQGKIWKKACYFDPIGVSFFFRDTSAGVDSRLRGNASQTDLPFNRHSGNYLAGFLYLLLRAGCPAVDYLVHLAQPGG